MSFLHRALPLAKEDRAVVGGGGLLARSSLLPPGYCPLAGFLLLLGRLALNGQMVHVDGVGRGREGIGSPDAWVLEVPGDGVKQGSGEARRAEKCGCGIAAPPLSYWRAPGGPSADYTEALPLGEGGLQGRKETRQRERTTNPESVTATLGASVPPAPWGDSEGFSCPPIPNPPS